MTKMIFINLPVTDLARSIAFYQAVGFEQNPQFSNDMASCMVWSEAIHVMLLTHDFWKTFTSKEIPDAHRAAQVLLCISRDSKEEVESIVNQAVDAGGKPDPTPVQDMGFMYGRSFEDPDGHIWETMWMDPQAAADGPPAEGTA
ncbi:VOC family protein [Parerythrobacter lacustris]|uniref:VOC family protein n=1 Tax=Parerythrobacter lacustris TaxID=2969984 RepID=A0ABT1XTU3_9SPHN|nr:VOC family protein [Parerythrobacter lacustris]MCR2835085.1 VOC family protein [Parerythrobacter lacustris]